MQLCRVFLCSSTACNRSSFSTATMSSPMSSPMLTFRNAASNASLLNCSNALSPPRLGLGVEHPLERGSFRRLGNFLSALATLHQIFDLLYSLWGKLQLPPTV